MQTAIPCVVMRGGTSKGPYFHLSDLPADPETRNRVLLAVMGSPDARQIDGIGGADWLTSKAAMVGPSSRDDADLDYLFAQVLIDRDYVDLAPNCGNMTSGVGPFAIEAGLIEATDPETVVRIFNVNTGAIIEAVIQTPGGELTYEGDTAIDGVPGTAAPVMLRFSNTVGTRTGKLLPTGEKREVINSVEVSCVDCAIPMVTARAEDMGKTGYETKAEFDADEDFFRRLEAIRVEASHRMGLGDPTGRVVPKFCIISPARKDGSVNARYFVPTKCHATFPLVGGMCLSATSMIDGTVTDGVVSVTDAPRQVVGIENPAGRLDCEIEFLGSRSDPQIDRVGFVRTTRRMFEGRVFVPRQVWDGET